MRRALLAVASCLGGLAVAAGCSGPNYADFAGEWVLAIDNYGGDPIVIHEDGTIFLGYLEDDCDGKLEPKGESRYVVNAPCIDESSYYTSVEVEQVSSLTLRFHATRHKDYGGDTKAYGAKRKSQE